MPARENNHAEPLADEVGWPVSFLATFISIAVQSVAGG